MTDCWSEVMPARRHWRNILKMPKGKKKHCQVEILYSLKVSFKNEGKNRCFLGIWKLKDFITSKKRWLKLMLQGVTPGGSLCPAACSGPAHAGCAHRGCHSVVRKGEPPTRGAACANLSVTEWMGPDRAARRARFCSPEMRANAHCSAARGSRSMFAGDLEEGGGGGKDDGGGRRSSIA